MTLLLAGCARPPQPAALTQVNRPADDSAVSISETLRKGADLEAWRTTVQQLNHYLGEHPDAKPRSLNQEEQELLANQFGLDKGELAEVESSTFTPLDAHHLDLCFSLRDAARALSLGDLPPLDRVTNGFAWVVRQVRLNERKGSSLPPLPVLRPGWGTARERALVFLALLDQLGIDGCMTALPAGTPGQTELRYWVPGALVDKEIYLFDTRLGLPLPGPDGKGIATWTQVRGGLDLPRILKVSDKFPYDVTPDSARHAEVHVAYTLSSLAPRMQFLQNYLAASEKVDLWVDPVARLKRFQAAAGTTVRVWNTPGDLDSPLRVLRSFLSPEEGGIAKQSMRELLRRQMVPWQYYPAQLSGLPGELGMRLRQAFAAPFVYFSMETRMPPDLLLMWLPGLSEASVDKPGTRKPVENLLRSPLPRDLMLHGRFDEAASLFVSIHEELQRQKALSADPKLDEDVQRWCEKAVEVYSDVIRAEQESRKTKGREVVAGGAVAEAKERVNQLWSASGRVMALLQAAAAEPMSGEVLYLLALCKHEQAERLQAKKDQAGRLGKSPSPAEARALTGAWRSASSWWESYLNEHASAPAAPAAGLRRARALQCLGERDAAIALLENLSGVSTDLQKTARLYLAKQLKTR